MSDNSNLKMVMLVFNISIQEEVMEILAAQGAACFTQWPRVVGKGATTGPKMDNDIWPGANSSVITVLPEPQANKLFDAIQELRDEIGSHEGVKAFILNVEKMTGEHKPHL